MDLNRKLIAYLVLGHCFIIAISNYLVQFPINIFGLDYTIGTFTFPIIVLATDLTVRLSNATNARKVIGYAFIPAFIISYIFADFRIAIASVLAYSIGQLLDVFVFSKVRERVGDDGFNLSSYWYLAPVVSTFFAQLIDTYLFYGVAFYNSADDFMRENWDLIAFNDFILKLVVCYLAFLPIYVLILNRTFNYIKTRT
ncbi:queuosine precursor transporter [Pelagibacterales bacterium SAG-MED32]|nr:queuosine precursor transporter [Pelagibacterales bacterium SAG-MED32]